MGVFNLLNIFKKKKERVFTEDTETEHVDDTEEESIRLMLIYEKQQIYLKSQRIDPRIYDPSYIPIIKEQERQNKEYLIHFEFIPHCQNFRNVRSVLEYTYNTYDNWKTIRDKVEKDHQGTCKICGKTSTETTRDKTRTFTTATECHEVWTYNELTQIQTLDRLEPLCVRCHEIKHINRFTTKPEYQNLLFKDYEAINGLIDFDNQEQINSRVYEDFNFSEKEKKRREEVKYMLDLSYLESLNLGYDYSKPVNVHTDSFNSFIEMNFKQNKNLEE